MEGLEDGVVGVENLGDEAVGLLLSSDWVRFVCDVARTGDVRLAVGDEHRLGVLGLEIVVDDIPAPYLEETSLARGLLVMVGMALFSERTSGSLKVSSLCADFRSIVAT